MKRKQLTSPATTQAKAITADYNTILSGMIDLLEQARRSAARAVNSVMTATYWEIGRRIVEFEQGGKKRAEYGEQLVEQLSGDLTARFGRGFGRSNLFQMKAFYLAFLDTEKVHTVSGQFGLAALTTRFPLSWSHYVKLLAVPDDKAENSTKQKLCAAAGQCASLTGRSAHSSTSGHYYRGTKPRC